MSLGWSLSGRLIPYIIQNPKIKSSAKNVQHPKTPLFFLNFFSKNTSEKAIFTWKKLLSALRGKWGNSAHFPNSQRQKNGPHCQKTEKRRVEINVQLVKTQKKAMFFCPPKETLSKGPRGSNSPKLLTSRASHRSGGSFFLGNKGFVHRECCIFYCSTL